jgi:hypothetical protein
MLYFTLFAFYSSLSFAGCEDDLLELFNSNPHAGTTTSGLDMDYSTNQSVLSFEREWPGKFGGKIRVYRHNHEKWLSKHRTVLYDPLGDPRWFLDVAGPEVAELLGVTLKGEEITFPDAQELVSRINWINSELKKRGRTPLAVTFYHQPKVGLQSYLEALRTQYAFPIAPPDSARLDNHYLHDMSFHLSSLFIPEEVMQRLAEQIKMFNAFIEFIKEKHVGADLESLKAFIYLVRLSFVEQLDYSSAWLTHEIVSNNISFAQNKRRNFRERPNVIRQEVERVDAFKHFLGKSGFFARGLSFFNGINPKLYHDKGLEFELSQKALSLHSKDDWSSYWVKFYKANAQKFNEEILRAPSEDEQFEFCRLLNNHRKDLRDLALDLLAEKRASARKPAWNWRNFLGRLFARPSS